MNKPRKNGCFIWGGTINKVSNYDYWGSTTLINYGNYGLSTRGWHCGQASLKWYLNLGPYHPLAILLVEHRACPTGSRWYIMRL